MSPETFAVASVSRFSPGERSVSSSSACCPTTFTTGGPRDMIGAVVGLLTLLSALTMGLLIWTAYGVYAGQNTAIQTLAAKVLQLDLALADYRTGGESRARAACERRSARRSTTFGDSRESDKNFVAENFAAAVRALRKEEGDLANSPSFDGCAEAGARSRDLDRRGDRPGAAADVVRADQSGFLSAHPDRGRLGYRALLRLRADVPRPHDVDRRCPHRRDRGFDLGLHDP